MLIWGYLCNLFIMFFSLYRWGSGDIGGFWQRRCGHTPRRSRRGAITDRSEPAEEETGPHPSPRDHRGRRGRGRGQGWRNRLRLVAPLHFPLPSADQETPLTQHRSKAIPMSLPPVTLAAVHLLAPQPATAISVPHPNLSLQWTSSDLFIFKRFTLSSDRK